MNGRLHLARFAALSVLCLTPVLSYAGGTSISYNGGRNYSYTERTDLRRYDNGKYTGLTSREVRSFMTDVTANADKKEGLSRYDGNFYVLEKTVRGKKNVDGGIQMAIPSSFTIGKDGELSIQEDNGFPSFRSFPHYPEEDVEPGDKWTGESLRAVDLGGGNIFIPMLVEYTYLREGTWKNEPVHIIQAKWATRFPGDCEIPDGMSSATGSHRATLCISALNGAMLLCSDTVDETFFYEDGKTVSFKGTISLFTDYAPKVDRREVRVELEKNREKIPDGITIDETDSGLRLTIKNLQFASDSADLLPGESERLDLIAEMLKKSPKSQYLVTGHTADVGNERGQQTLSEERAKAIAGALIERGIPKDQIVCKGMGVRVPVATNSTPEGMARNRRVEITILE
ncbi:MAG: OmpA family protein [Treponema sp.]|nr:OmpA family protein [Treponema sp.]